MPAGLLAARQTTKKKNDTTIQQISLNVCLNDCGDKISVVVHSALCCVFITLQRGQGLLITVHYDGLLRRCSAVLPNGMGLIVETLHVKLQVAVTVKPEI